MIRQNSLSELVYNMLLEISLLVIAVQEISAVEGQLILFQLRFDIQIACEPTISEDNQLFYIYRIMQRQKKLREHTGTCDFFLKRTCEIFITIMNNDHKSIDSSIRVL